MWTLSYGPAKKPLADWGISGLQRRRSSQAVDQVSFLVALPFDAEAPFPADAEIAIQRDDVGWFVGRVVGMRREATGSAEAIRYEIAGPWWYLDRAVYQQIWRWYDGSPYTKSHAILNQTDQGHPLGTRGQIAEVLQLVSDRAQSAYGSTPFQWDPATFPDINIPSDEVRDLTCAEVVRKQLRWLPDAVTWFDYSTTPPTFRCARRSALDTVDVTQADNLASVSATPRYDLQVPVVCLKFERVDSVNGQSVLNLNKQIAPAGATGDEFGALVATIDLLGFSATSASATLKTFDLPLTPSQNPAQPVSTADKIAWRDWIKTKQAHLTDPRVEILDVVSVRRESRKDSGLWAPRELVAGQIPPWLNFPSWEETAHVRLKLAIRDTNGAIMETGETTFSVNFVGTLGTTGTWSTTTSAQAGEVEPAGLASALYQALSVLEWDGELRLVGQEINGRIGVGHRLNLVGFRPEWATMAATVQEVAESIDTGETSIRFGPPQHLGPRDLVELLRVGRFRYNYTAPSMRSTGSAPTGSLALGSVTPKENGEGGVRTTERLVVQQGGGRVILDGSDCVGLELKVREVEVCLNGTKKRMLLIASNPY